FGLKLPKSDETLFGFGIWIWVLDLDLGFGLYHSGWNLDGIWIWDLGWKFGSSVARLQSWSHARLKTNPKSKSKTQSQSQIQVQIQILNPKHINPESQI
ncbi:unnamed protein product, partial [Rotaria sp. Silwood2]